MHLADGTEYNAVSYKYNLKMKCSKIPQRLYQEIKLMEKNANPLFHPLGLTDLSGSSRGKEKRNRALAH